MTVCLTNPGKVAMTRLVSSCQRAKSAAASGRTRVWVMIVVPSPSGAVLALPRPLTAGSRAGRRSAPV